jgi:large subunit ribosomal protein L31
VFARPHLALVGNQGANKESYMKKGIHPEYMETTVRCSCGNTWTTHSTVPEMRLDLCDKCHPFYTGTQKLVDTGGRVQRFADKFGGAAKAEAAKQERAKKAAEETAAHAAAASAKAEAKAARAKAYAEKAAAEEATKKAEAATEEAAAEAEATVAEAAEEAAE